MSQTPAAVCTNCGAALPPGATFCPTCGTAVTAAAPRPPAGGPAPGRPVLSDADRRNWAMGVHLTALAGAFVGGIGSWVGPLVIWLLRREDGDPFVTEHAREGLNFNITVAILVAAGFLFGFITLGLGFLVVLPFLLVVGLLWLIWTIQAAMAASRGESYRYPMSIRLIS